MISWSPALPPALLALAVLGVAAALWWSRRTLRARVGHDRLWWPRLGLGLLLLLALSGPRWRSEELRPPAGSLAILVDTSSSMELRDGQRDSRLQRARRLADRLCRAAPGGLGVEVLACDTRLRAALPDSLPAGERPGDPRRHPRRPGHGTAPERPRRDRAAQRWRRRAAGADPAAGLSAMDHRPRPGRRRHAGQRGAERPRCAGHRRGR